LGQDGNKSLSDLRNLLQALADQLDDSDEDRVATSQNNFGRMAPSYLVAVSAPAAEQAKAAEIITQVMAMRLDQVKAAITVVDGLLEELTQGHTVGYKKIQYPGIEEILS
jgi:hypothetical protein